MKRNYVLTVRGLDPSAESWSENTRLRLNEKEYQDLILFLTRAAKIFKEHENYWMTSEYIWEDENYVHPDEMYAEHFTCKEFSKLEGWMPYGERGIETIDSITLREVVSELEFMRVE